MGKIILIVMIFCLAGAIYSAYRYKKSDDEDDDFSNFDNPGFI